MQGVNNRGNCVGEGVHGSFLYFLLNFFFTDLILFIFGCIGSSLLHVGFL